MEIDPAYRYDPVRYGSIPLLQLLRLQSEAVPDAQALRHAGRSAGQDRARICPAGCVRFIRAGRG